MAHITYLQTRRHERQLVQQQILALVGKTDEQISGLVHSFGLTFLIEHTDSESYQELHDAPPFWDWWCNQWHLRDRHFLDHEPGLVGLSQGLIYDRYVDLHLLQESRHFPILQRTEMAFQAFYAAYFKSIVKR